MKIINKNEGTEKVKIKTEFISNNLIIFSRYFNIFSFFNKSNVFEKSNKFIGIEKNKIYNELDYIKILITILIFGFINMNHISLIK